MRLILAKVGNLVDGEHLTANDEAILAEDLRANWCGALGSIESQESSKVTMVHIPELLRGLHRELEPTDPIDGVLARGGHDDLVVQVPHNTGKICSIDILQRVS